MPARHTLVAITLACTIGCGLTDIEETDVGDAPICAGAEEWPVEFATLETQMTQLISHVRNTGTRCGTEDLAGVGDLMVVPELHCAARLDATARVEAGDDIDQMSKQVTPVFSRVNLSGYDGEIRHQILAADYFDAQSLFDAWMMSEGHCRALLDPDIQHIGIGHSRADRDSRAMWVLLTGLDREN